MKELGSYAFGAFEHNDEELNRLKSQAGVLADLELSLLRQMGLEQGMHVMDLACGTGALTRAMAAVVGAGAVVGVDANPLLLAEAVKETPADFGDRVKFEQRNVYQLDMGENGFDFIYARLLFQHLSEPLKAMTQILRALKPGGKAVVMDVDDDWLSIFPEPAGYRDFLDLAGRGQEVKGGDRRVGRKLAVYFERAGFVAPEVRLVAVTSRMIGMRPFLDITTRFKMEQVPAANRAEAGRGLEQIYGELESSDAMGILGAFMVSAVKPGREV